MTPAPVFPPDALPTPDGEPAEVPHYRLAHLSDCHLTSEGVLYNAVVDADAGLAKLVAELARAVANGRGFDAIIASGDLTDTGDRKAYQRLSAALSTFAVPIIYATGNHDVRETFHQELLGRSATESVVQVRWLKGRLRIVVLDSTIAGAGHGRLSTADLAELAEILASPAPDGTIVVLHHAPIPPPSPLLTYFTLERVSRRALESTIAGTDVRLVLAGHHHLAQSGILGGIPVAVAGSTAIRTDPLAKAGHERTTRSAGFNLVDLYPDTLTVSVIPLDEAETVFELDRDGCAAVVRAHSTGKEIRQFRQEQQRPGREQQKRSER